MTSKVDTLSPARKQQVASVLQQLLKSSTNEAATILAHMVKGAMEMGRLDDIPGALVLWYLENRVLWLIKGEMQNKPYDDRWAMARDITMLMAYVRESDRWSENDAILQQAAQVSTTCHRFLVQRRAWAVVAADDLSYGGAIPSPSGKAVKSVAELAQRA